MNYTVQELIHNQSFRRMVKGEADADEINRWNRWIEAKDENRQKAKEATAEIAGFEFKDPEFPNIDAEWKLLQKVTASQKRSRLPAIHHKNDGSKWLYRAAAILLLVGLIGAGIYISPLNISSSSRVKQIAQATTVKTGPSEQKTLTFSDGSKITLNSHSTLTYRLNKLQDQPIDVELKGEAYFDAEKGKSEFLVHTPDGIIQDIGTKFLVTVEKNHSRVILQAGKVQVNLKHKTDKGQKITMEKDEMLSFDSSHILSKKEVNATYYTSWATGYMQFDQTSLQKFAGFVGKRFNVDVKIVDPELKNVTIGGSIYFKSLAGLIHSVSKVLRIPAYQSKDGETVYLGTRDR